MWLRNGASVLCKLELALRLFSKGVFMKAAITELTIALETAKTNEPINRAEGNIEQADLEATNAADFRQALAMLTAASNGPIWPKPQGE
jgi:hypothetical protein